MATEEEMDAALDILDNVECVMACTSTYPTKVDELNLRYVTTLTDKLNSTWQEISTKLYQQTEQTENPQESPKEEDATDVEYEEVK